MPRTMDPRKPTERCIWAGCEEPREAYLQLCAKHERRAEATAASNSTRTGSPVGWLPFRSRERARQHVEQALRLLADEPLDVQAVEQQLQDALKELPE